MSDNVYMRIAELEKRVDLLSGKVGELEVAYSRRVVLQAAKRVDDLIQETDNLDKLLRTALQQIEGVVETLRSSSDEPGALDGESKELAESADDAENNFELEGEH